MTSEAGLPPAPQLPAQAQHAKKASVEEAFEQRWRKAYEVRALERESRQGRGSQASSRGSSIDSQRTLPAVAGKAGLAGLPAPAEGATALELAAAAGQGAAAALSRLASGSGPGPGPQAAAVPAEAQPQREREVVEEEEEEEEVGGTDIDALRAALAEAGVSGQPPAGQQAQDDDGPELDCTVVWDSAASRQAWASPPLSPGRGAAALGAAGEAALALKEQGNLSLRGGDFEGAVRAYSEALAACRRAASPPRREPAAQQGAAEPPPAQRTAEEQEAVAKLRATLLSNRAHALLRLKREDEAAADALHAHRLHPSWPKPLYRLAQARLAVGQWAAAVAACRAGEALAPRNAEGHTEFTPLLDRTAVLAARAGSLAGYDGLQLEVRCAGPDAWLGKAAPHVPELDGPEDEDGLGVVTHLPAALPALPAGQPACGAAAAPGTLAAAGDGGRGAAGGDKLVAWDFREAVGGRRRRTSFRCLREAVEAARDGDRILLRAGTHNGMGECVTVNKRLLIEGEGRLGDATLDHRANVPAFRIARGGVVLRRLELDMCGFREALLVEGPCGARPHPLVADCTVKCSGDDAVNVGGAAAPTFLRCTISGKKVGVKAFGSSAPRLEACVIEKCEGPGVRAMEASEPSLHGCLITGCGEEAAVAMDAARLTLEDCRLTGCKGPGVDVSGGAAVTLNGARVAGCVGGVWLWDAARATLRGADVAGGTSHAVLADGAAAIDARDTTVRGSVHATDAAWAGLLRASNRLLDPEQATDFPPEQGPFRFEPDPHTRKQ